MSVTLKIMVWSPGGSLASAVSCASSKMRTAEAEAARRDIAVQSDKFAAAEV